MNNTTSTLLHIPEFSQVFTLEHSEHGEASFYILKRGDVLFMPSKGGCNYYSKEIARTIWQKYCVTGWRPFLVNTR